MFKFQDDARPCYHCPYRRSDFDIVDLQKIYGGKIFFLTKTVFQSARPTACDSRAERASRLTLRFHPRLIANAPSSGPSACTGFFVCVSFKILCMNHVYQYLICPSINFMMIANIL